MNIISIRTIRQLANYLLCEEVYLNSFLGGNIRLIDPDKDAEEQHYPEYTTLIAVYHVPKRNSPSEFRKLTAAYSGNLKSILKILNGKINELYKPPSCVQGYVKKRNTRTNASFHLAKKTILSVDIENFYDSITLEMVEAAFSSLGFSSFASKQLSKVVTYGGYLPQGYNTSPTISNIVLKKIDEELVALAGAVTVYTRYSDDLYFSSNSILPAIDDIRQIIIKNGFQLNEKKTQTMKRGGQQYVTGLTVFDSNLPRIPKKIKRNLRLEIYYYSKDALQHSLRSDSFTLLEYENNNEIRNVVHTMMELTEHRIEGWLNYIASVEPKAAALLRKQYLSR